MNVLLRKSWTQEQFFAWAERQDVGYEFDGTQPVAMTGGNAGHAAIGANLKGALHARLRGTGCRQLGSDAGVQTIGSAVRYPDALITCAGFDLAARTIPGVIVVFEVISPTSGRIDRIIKVREYAAVASIRCYVIVESTTVGLTVMERAGPDEPWRATTLSEGEILRLLDIGIELPVAELYDGIVFPAESEDGR